MYTIVYPIDFTVSTAYIRGVPYGCDKSIDDSKTLSYKKCATAKNEAPATISEPEPPQIVEGGVTGAVVADVADDEPKEDKSSSAHVFIIIGVLAAIAIVLYNYMRKK